MKNLLLLSLLLSFSLNFLSDDENSTKDSSEKENITISDLVKDYSHLEGYFDSYLDPKTGEVFLQIKQNQIDKEFIYFAHVIDGVVAARRNRGSYLDNGVFILRKHLETIRLERVTTNYTFDEDLSLAKSAGANVSNSTLKVFPIIAYNEEKNQLLVNITSLLLSESLTPIKPITNHDHPNPNKFIWGGISSEKSKINNVYNYPQNTDFEVEYVIENPPSYSYKAEDVVDPRNISITLRYSFIEMPVNDFEPRVEDQNIGYFSEKITDLSSKDATPYLDLINKWYLEKKYPEKEKSEPVKPITFWLENSTPKDLREYIKQGVLAWNAAFEEAGFINAIEVKVQPDEAEWDAGDIRYNVIRWTSSPDAPFGGYGPSFVNPRTGEILGADIMLEWVYLTNRLNVDGIFKDSHSEECDLASSMQEGLLFGNLVNNLENNPKIVEQSIIRLALHEVGHTLGLNHNFKGSFLHDPVTVHKPEITSKIGVTSSVMEYPAINLAPPGVKQGDYYDIVPGPYDKWAIKFGYTPNLSEREREMILNDSVKPEYMFANDSEDMRSTGRGIDPRAMINDLTNDPITYSNQRLDLIDKVMSELPTKLKNATTWQEYRNALNILFRESQRALATVSRYIGGVYVNRTRPYQNTILKPYEPVPGNEQRRALQVLSERAFSPQAFQINSELLHIVQLERRGFDLRGEYEDPQIHKNILKIQNSILDHILNPWVLYRITDTNLYGNDYNIHEFMGDLTNSIFIEDISQEVSYIRQNLQTTYVRKLFNIVANDFYDEISVSAAYTNLRTIEKLMKKTGKDDPTKSHRKLLLWIISSGLDNAN